MSRPHTQGVLQHLRTLTADADAGPSDRELLGRFAGQRDEAAFTLLVRRHGPMVQRLCQRLLHDPQEAEDACQAVFLVLARKADARGWQPSVASWLHRVAYHLALKARAAAARRSLLAGKAAPRTTEDPLEAISGRELQTLLDEELARLPEKLRAPLVLCYLEGATRDEAGRQLGCPLGTLKSRLERGRELLRTRLARRGLALSAVLSTAALVDSRVDAARVVQGALAFTAGNAEPLSLRATDWARATLRALTLGRLKVAALFLLAVMLLGGGGLLAYQALSSQQPPIEKKQEAKSPETGAALDRFGDPLPAGAVARFGELRLRHVEATSVAFAPDGKGLVSVGRNHGVARLWDPASGKGLHRYHEEIGARGRVAFSPDGKTLAGVVVYDREAICLWDVATAREIRTCKVEPRPGTGLCVAYAPDGKTVVTANTDNALCLFDPATGKEVRRLTGPKDIVWAITWSPDGKVLAAGGKDNSVFLWDTSTWKLLHHLTGHEKDVNALAFTADSKILATGSHDLTVRLWDVATGKETRRFAFDEYLGETLGVCFVPGKPQLLAGNRWAVRLWDLTTGQEMQRFPGLLEMSDDPLACSPDGKLLVITGHDGPELYELATGKRLLKAQGHQRPIVALAVAPDGKLLASSSWDGTIRLWDPATSRELRQLPLPPMGGPLVFTPDGTTLLSGGDDDMVRFWDVTTGKETRNFFARADAKAKVAGLCGLRLSPDGKLLATAGRDGSVGLWDVAGGKAVHRLEGHHEAVLGVTFSPDGRFLASVGEDRSVRLWDVAAGREVRQFKGLQQRGTSVAFAPDGKTLAASGFDGRIYLWDVATGREVRRFEGDPGWIEGISFSPDGRLLASAASDGIVHVWEVASGKERQQFRGHQSYVWRVAFLPDGQRLASGGFDAMIYLWDVRGR